MDSIKIEDLYDRLEDIFSERFTGVMVECCALCLQSQGHSSSTVLASYEHNQNIFSEGILLDWSTKITAKILSAYRDEIRVTDHGAMCIALLLASKLTEFDGIVTSHKGDGVDFWFSKGDDIDFSARLEVSGIRKENDSNTVKKRLKIKFSQTAQSDNSNIPAFVSIIEFSKPKAIYISK